MITDGSSELTLEGGTHNPWSPPFDFLETAFLPVVESMAVVVTGDRPHEMATSIGLARAALLEGLDVSVFFRERGVRALSKFFIPRRSLSARLLGRRTAHPHGDVFRLFDHGAHIYACAISMEDHGITPDELLSDDITVAEYATLVRVMKEADIQLVG